MATGGGGGDSKLLGKKGAAANSGIIGAYSARNPQYTLVTTPHGEVEFSLDF